MPAPCKPRLFLTPHALGRLREHWERVRAMSDHELCLAVLRRVDTAWRAGKRIETPGGTLVPFSLEGDDGYAVLHRMQIVTVLRQEWCKEANEIARKNDYDS